MRSLLYLTGRAPSPFPSKPEHTPLAPEGNFSPTEGVYSVRLLLRRRITVNLAPHRITARLAIACAALLAAAIVAPGAHAEEWTKSYAISGRAQVRVDTNDGSVNISTSDSKQVEFVVDYEGFELNKNLHIDSRQDGDSVQLNARESGHWGFSWGKGRRIRIEVRMPKDADLQIDTGDGSVNTQSINGRVKIHTGDGSVRAQAVNGDVDID